MVKEIDVLMAVPLMRDEADLWASVARAGIPSRFWDKVSKDGPVWAGTRCWLWRGAKDRVGYGHFGAEGKSFLSHRYIYTAIYGTIPDDREIDHTCRVRSCVNPLHLDLVTHQENTRRAAPYRDYSLTRWPKAQQTHCKRGHPLTDGNLRPSCQGRQCRTCALERDRRRHQLKRTGATEHADLVEATIRRLAAQFGLTPIERQPGDPEPTTVERRPHG